MRSEEKMDKTKILVVDDESRMRKLVKDFLVRQGYTVLEAADGMEAMDYFYEDKDIALIILDVMMPKMDGWQVCREIRMHSKVPIIMLTARSEERDELQGFDLGVDEYISKPFSPKILVARVEAILRRTQGSGNTDEISAGGIVVDKAAHTVMSDGSPVDLSFKEFELLTYFIENQGIALSREKILNNVWNYDYFGDARTIDTHVKKLRSKLGDKGTLADLITVSGERVYLPRKKQYRYLMLYKPRGYVTTTSDELNRRCVMDLLEDVEERVYPVGRLDKDSEGLLLLTNDGNFANGIMHPSRHISKTYRVTVRPDVTEEQLITLSSSMELDGKMTQPATVVVKTKEPGRVVLLMTIHEGKNRQIRRMCESVGLEVARLRRTSIGPLKLGMLKPGTYRDLTAEELRAIRNAIGAGEQASTAKGKRR
jgi:two-component system response regulator ResD